MAAMKPSHPVSETSRLGKQARGGRARKRDVPLGSIFFRWSSCCFLFTSLFFFICFCSIVSCFASVSPIAPSPVCPPQAALFPFWARDFQKSSISSAPRPASLFCRRPPLLRLRFFR